MARHQDNCEICRKIGEAREGRHAGLIAELDTGFAVLGDSQFFHGYSLLLCKTPATELHELPRATRLRYLEEMSQLAEAVALATGCDKLNYECLGNQVPHLHFHIFPRRATDPDPKAPVWGQMPQGEAAAASRLDGAREFGGGGSGGSGGSGGGGGGGVGMRIRTELSKIRGTPR